MARFHLVDASISDWMRTIHAKITCEILQVNMSELEDAISSCVATAVDFKYGCTDESATNFDPDADADNGSCVFEGQSSDDSTGETSQETNGDFPDASIPPPVNGDFGYIPEDNMNKAGVFGGTNPIAIIGFVAVAAVILVMANRKPAQPVTA